MTTPNTPANGGQILTWQERVSEYSGPFGYSEPEQEAMKAEIADLRAALDAKQAEIDRLMLEFCPDEMTPEQVKKWGDSQHKAKQSHERKPLTESEIFQIRDPIKFSEGLEDDECDLALVRAIEQHHGIGSDK